MRQILLCWTWANINMPALCDSLSSSWLLVQQENGLEPFTTKRDILGGEEKSFHTLLSSVPLMYLNMETKASFTLNSLCELYCDVSPSFCSTTRPSSSTWEPWRTCCSLPSSTTTSWPCTSSSAPCSFETHDPDEMCTCVHPMWWSDTLEKPALASRISSSVLFLFSCLVPFISLMCSHIRGCLLRKSLICGSAPFFSFGCISLFSLLFIFTSWPYCYEWIFLKTVWRRSYRNNLHRKGGSRSVLTDSESRECSTFLYLFYVELGSN